MFIRWTSLSTGQQRWDSSASHQPADTATRLLPAATSPVPDRRHSVADSSLRRTATQTSQRSVSRYWSTSDVRRRSKFSVATSSHLVACTVRETSPSCRHSL